MPTGGFSDGLPGLPSVVAKCAKWDGPCQMCQRGSQSDSVTNSSAPSELNSKPERWLPSWVSQVNSQRTNLNPLYMKGQVNDQNFSPAGWCTDKEHYDWNGPQLCVHGHSQWAGKRSRRCSREGIMCFQAQPNYVSKGKVPICPPNFSKLPKCL